MRIGEYDQIITIRTMTQGQGATYNEPTETPVDWRTEWAKVTEVAGGEIYAGRQVSGETTAVFETRWFDGLGVTMTISFDGRVYDILKFQPLGLRRKTSLMIEAKARVS